MENPFKEKFLFIKILSLAFSEFFSFIPFINRLHLFIAAEPDLFPPIIRYIIIYNETLNIDTMVFFNKNFNKTIYIKENIRTENIIFKYELNPNIELKKNVKPSATIDEKIYGITSFNWSFIE
jgi:hypothetical protein